jgi:hypothetical protein
VRAVEDTYCKASFYLAMCKDDRYSNSDREQVRRQVAVREFDLFADPNAIIPGDLLFAAETIYAVTGDPRLLRSTQSTS